MSTLTRSEQGRPAPYPCIARGLAQKKRTGARKGSGAGRFKGTNGFSPTKGQDHVRSPDAVSAKIIHGRNRMKTSTPRPNKPRDAAPAGTVKDLSHRRFRAILRQLTGACAPVTRRLYIHKAWRGGEQRETTDDREGRGAVLVAVFLLANGAGVERAETTRGRGTC